MHKRDTFCKINKWVPGLYLWTNQIMLKIASTTSSNKSQNVTVCVALKKTTRWWIIKAQKQEKKSSITKKFLIQKIRGIFQLTHHGILTFVHTQLIILSLWSNVLNDADKKKSYIASNLNFFLTSTFIIAQ